MLDQEMSAADLAFEFLLDVEIRAQVGSVILAHVVLQRLAVGVLRRLPSRLFAAGVEVVRQVLAVGVANLPARGQSSGLSR